MDKPIVLSAECLVDLPDRSLDTRIEQELRDSRKNIEVLTIDPLSVGWDTQKDVNHFRSGNAPIEALVRANGLIARGNADAVVIQGKDHLKTDFPGEEGKMRRKQLMDIYHGISIPEAYTMLTHRFIEQTGISESAFKLFANKLYMNYLRTAINRNLPMNDNGFVYSTDLFCMVDCANPKIDFEGKIILGNSDVADLIGIREKERVYLMGAAAKRLASDGPKNISEIVKYDHLKTAYEEACGLAGIDFRKQYLDGNALLEAYTCFPVVPLAFLFSTGIADTKNLFNILSHHEVTVTGGMNLSRAPWSNPALYASIVMIEQLKQGKAQYGGVHGNGGLGYKQGFGVFGMDLKLF